MSFVNLPPWIEAPFIRLIIPLIAGILVQWYVTIELIVYLVVVPVSLILLFLFSYISSFNRFSKYWLSGIIIIILFAGTGGLLLHYRDIRNSPGCISNMVGSETGIMAMITEPLMEKKNSFKAEALVTHLLINDKWEKTNGGILVYFQKDSVLPVTVNRRIFFRKKLQLIRNTGNPGGYDYQRYCIFHDQFYQVYLTRKDYILLPQDSKINWRKLIHGLRASILGTIRTYIKGEKEAGLAEALLIGYKNDLDKDLVKSYSNTGVVHIIAISGLHVGLIYWLLTVALRRIIPNKKLRWIKAIIIIAGLWFFSILTGGSASVCRSALMFSFIVAGENLDRKTNIFNSLAASAFLLLCYNPYWLWDAGFQLSYIAVVSIVIFMKPVYHALYIKNKMLDQLWRMAAVTIAAQVLTTPITVYYFQQFPNYFLLTNMVAVPLSSIVVLAEIALCLSSFTPIVSVSLGKVTGWLLQIMNNFIAYVNTMPFTVTTDLQLSFVEMLVSYLAICLLSTWLLHKNRTALLLGIACCIAFVSIKSFENYKAASHENLVVYKIPKQQAIDLVTGRTCFFIGDKSVTDDPAIYNFVLKPARSGYKINQSKQVFKTSPGIRCITIAGKKVLIITGDTRVATSARADIVILSHAPNLDLTALKRSAKFSMIVFDCSNPGWKILRWKQECVEAGIACYPVEENGAFILKPN